MAVAAVFVTKIKSNPRMVTILRYVLLAFVSIPIFGLLIVPPVHMLARDYFELMHGGAVNWVLPMSLLFLFLVVNLDTRLKKLNNRWLEWSLFHLKANITLLPLSVRYLRVPYLLALAYCVPALAWAEEKVFREGTESWLKGALWGGLIFGFAHLIACVSIRMAFCLSIAGMGLVAIYFVTGLTGATLVHATYNLVAITWVVWSELGAGRRVMKMFTHPKFTAQFPTIISWATRLRPWLAAPART